MFSQRSRAIVSIPPTSKPSLPYTAANTQPAITNKNTTTITTAAAEPLPVTTTNLCKSSCRYQEWPLHSSHPLVRPFPVLHRRHLAPSFFFFLMHEGKQAKGNKKLKKNVYWVASSLKDHKSYPKVRDKCLETSLLKEVRSQEEGNIEIGREFQSLPEKDMND
ncbi:hypothetical protein E2C01_092584 [Portunus trituberculatus]|uniref:Uncharacterized protein n=1 Tax=Portunus trituberculatus TaxID=210409 RepID=A0A5B7JW67_PORTR|nr:hypothetical protein [Portunus trituberculatus]